MKETKVRSAKPSDRAGGSALFSAGNAEERENEVQPPPEHQETPTSAKPEKPGESLPLGLSFSEPGTSHDPGVPAPQTPTVPPILLEGDEPAAREPARTEPQKFAVAPTPAETRSEPPRAELPQAYGTGQLLLVARDPGCLYAHWDPNPKQVELSRRSSVEPHLRLRIHEDSLQGPVVTELPVRSESR